MELGLRYRFPHVGLEFSWCNRFSRVSNRSTASSTEIRNTLSFTTSTFCFGGELYFGRVGFGGSFDINTIRIKTTKPGFPQRDESDGDTYITNHIFVSFELPINEFFSLSVRPYVQIPAKSYNFYKTAAHLNTEVGADTGQFRDRITTFGIKLVFLNGEKNYEVED